MKLIALAFATILTLAAAPAVATTQMAVGTEGHGAPPPPPPPPLPKPTGEVTGIVAVKGSVFFKNGTRYVSEKWECEKTVSVMVYDSVAAGAGLDTCEFTANGVVFEIRLRPDLVRGTAMSPKRFVQLLVEILAQDIATKEFSFVSTTARAYIDATAKSFPVVETQFNGDIVIPGRGTVGTVRTETTLRSR